VTDDPFAPVQAGVAAAPVRDALLAAPMETDLRALFHRLNNQLGIILAHAELLEARATTDDVARARAGQVVASVLDAMGTAKEIRRRCESEHSGT
jgi:hypothetical protein